MCFFFCKQKAAYEMRISDWSSDVCSSDLAAAASAAALGKVDILVCSAGITGATAPVHEYPLDSWRRVIDINLNGLRSEERRVGKECVSTWRSRWSPSDV